MSVFIVAEISANHNQSLDLALKTVQSAIQSGADAIKVQTFMPDSLALNIDSEIFGPKTHGPWKGWRPWDLYQKAALPYEWHRPIQKLVEGSGKVFFSSPFDLEAIDFLENLSVPIYKIASFEINDIPLIRKAALTQKPIILSTGVASLEDIHAAIQACRDMGNDDITLLKCTSEYPATLSQANLLKMNDFKIRFNVKVGVSDHSQGFIVPVAATAMGATVIEKHFVLDRSQGGLDATFSMEPQEFAEMVFLVREVEKTSGTVSYDVSECNESRKRSLFVTRPIKKDEVFSSENIRSLRPNIGLPPIFYSDVLLSRASRDLAVGHPLKKNDLIPQS
jgi:pseudaminic acid synthase